MLAAAAEILAEEGLQGLTLRACARRAGVSHAAPAHHFAGLTGLRTAIAAESFQMIAVAVEDVYQRRGARADDLLKYFAVAYSQFAKTNPERFRLMFRRDLLDIEDQDLCDSEARAYSTFVKIVHALRGEEPATLEDFRAGRLTKEMYLDVSIYWSAVHGFAHLNIENQLVGYDEIMGADDLEAELWIEFSKRMVGSGNQKA
ncbi:MAG: AcrR family transcriptional regulator [Maritalea sp.]|jgi:AcrR family transcriptional regulator